MPLAPIEPRLEVRSHPAGPITLRRWEAPGSIALLLLLPTRPELTAGYDAYAAALSEAGVGVALLLETLEPGASSTEVVAVLLAALRAERPGQPFVLAGHGAGAMVVGEYLASTNHQPDLVALLAPTLATAQASKRLGRSLPMRRAAPASAPQLASERLIKSLSDTSMSVYIAAGWQDPLADPAVLRRLQAVRPIGDVWNYPAAGHDLPNMGLPTERAGDLAAWILRRASERWPQDPRWARAPRARDLDRATAMRRHAAFVTSEGERLAAFEARVGAGGGPDLDSTRDGFARLGAWLLDAIGEGGRSGSEPEWAQGLAGPVRRLSTESLWLIDGTAAYVLASLRESASQVRWELCTDRRDSYLHESLLEPLHLSTDLVVGNLLRSLLASQTTQDWLARIRDPMVNRLETMRGVTESDEALPLGEVAVAPYDGDPWNAQLWIPEGAESVLGRQRFEALAPAIEGLTGVRRLAWEDREVMLVELAPGTDLDALRQRIVELLRTARKAAAADEAGAQ